MRVGKVEDRRSTDKAESGVSIAKDFKTAGRQIPLQPSILNANAVANQALEKSAYLPRKMRGLRREPRWVVERETEARYDLAREAWSLGW